MMRPTSRHPITACAVVRPLIVGYADRTLAREARSLVARHLTDCPACDAEYLRIRALSRELAASMPAIGGEGRPLGRMWQEIAAQIRRARRKPVSTPRLATGTVALVLAIAFALTQGSGSVMSAPPTQPTAASLSDGTPIALAFTAAVPPVTFTVTPTPQLQSNYAPTPGATEAP